MNITLPVMQEGQDGWYIYQSIPCGTFTPPDHRAMWQRGLYKSLMWCHDKAESLWHWCYDKSRPYAPPATEILTEPFLVYSTQAFKKERLTTEVS